MKNKNFTPVIFRKFKNGGDIIAIFPTIPGNYHHNTCESYQRVGQHGSCSIDFTTFTVPATPEEYAGLLEELVSIGYDDLKVYKHAMYWMYQEKSKTIGSYKSK